MAHPTFQSESSLSLRSFCSLPHNPHSCGTLFSWFPVVSLVAMMLVDVERHDAYISLFVRALR